MIQENETLKKQINDLKSNNNDLKKEIEFLKDKYNNLSNTKANESTASSFCNWSYVDYYFRDDFEDNFQKMVENLLKESKNYFKSLFLRILAINYNRKETLFFDEELEKQKTME